MRALLTFLLVLITPTTVAPTLQEKTYYQN